MFPKSFLCVLFFSKFIKIQGESCETQLCFQKCCEEDHSMQITCRKENNLTIDLTNELKSTFDISIDSITISYSNGLICREGSYRVFVDVQNKSELQGDKLHVNYIDQPNVFHNNTEFCVDFFKDDGESDLRFGALVCFSDEEVAEDEARIGMLISMPFLAITFIVYALLPDKNLYQNALMIYVLTLFLAYLLLVLINYVTMMENAACVIIGYLTLFSFTTSFFWLNVICFDIWFTFSRGRSIVGGRRNSELKKLGFYSIYAFGVPLLLIILIYLLQTKILDPSSIHNPKIGVGKCFLETGWPSLWYLYLEAGLIIIANLVFFSWTAISIRKVKKETAMLKHNDSKRHAYEKNQKKFNLFIKLAFAMGINWSTEIISWFVNWQTDSAYSKIWIVTDCVNALYGVFIFFIFVFKKKTWRLLKRRYYAFRGKVYLAHSMGGTSRPTNVSTTESTVTTTVNGPRRPEDNILLHDRR